MSNIWQNYQLQFVNCFTVHQGAVLLISDCHRAPQAEAVISSRRRESDAGSYSNLRTIQITQSFHTQELTQ